jgi:hypothetical protein
MGPVIWIYDAAVLELGDLYSGLEWAVMVANGVALRKRSRE